MISASNNTTLNKIGPVNSEKSATTRDIFFEFGFIGTDRWEQNQPIIRLVITSMNVISAMTLNRHMKNNYW